MYKTMWNLDVSERFIKIKEILCKLTIYMASVDETKVILKLEELKRLDKEFCLRIEKGE